MKQAIKDVIHSATSPVNEKNYKFYTGIGGIKNIVEVHGVLIVKEMLKSGQLMTNQECIDYIENLKIP